MSLSLRLKDFQDSIKQTILTNASAVMPSINSKDRKTGPPTLIDIKEDSSAIGSDSLDEVLQGMQTCLAKAIGPIAAVVLRDAMHQWKQHPSTDSNDFAMLKKIVLFQIDDPDHKQKFEELIMVYPFKRAKAKRLTD